MAQASGKQHELLQDPIPKLLFRLAFPVGVGFFFNTMFNVVDTFYAGLISTQAQAAISLSFPLFFLMIAVGSGISTASTSLVGHALGAGNRREAELYAAQTLSFAILHGILLSIAGLAAAPALLGMLGAQGEYLKDALSYIGAIYTGAAFFILNQAQNGILSASGDTRSFRNFLITSFLLNLVYDPWFIYGGLGLPPLGISGIAWATVCIQGLGTLYMLRKVLATGLISWRSRRLALPSAGPFRNLAFLGFPASLTMLTVAIGVFVITWFVGKYGSEAVAAYGIATRIEQVLLLPVMGLNVATLALISQNRGALRFDRVRETVKFALSRGLMLVSLGSAAVFIAAGALMTLFSKDPVVTGTGAVYLRFAAFAFPAYVVLYINSFALQGIRKPQLSLAIGVYRQFVAPLPIFWLLANHLGWGLNGIWGGIVVINWSAALISLVVIRKVMKGLEKL
ncbi:putative transporter [Geobacter sp. OR-1]|uniref:MATE family efflux transporter n=1 Tax=Geobacter sp. OR-1 TaxID=1266765 RepID=UPI0005428DC4|nr:MATE family efflux transporter [Geobacter sp. OR-1]GAM08829.1 putative transporter [Geobacter sp. OR-1]